MITVTVEGPRGEGKTHTATRLVLLLRKLGFTVMYEAPTAEQSVLLEETLQQLGERILAGRNEPRAVLVRDVAGS